MELTCVASDMIGNHCIRDVLLKLARCLAMFPNLQVFRLDHTERKSFHINQAITYYGFGRYKSFPQIRSARCLLQSAEIFSQCAGVMAIS